MNTRAHAHAHRLILSPTRCPAARGGQGPRGRSCGRAPPCTWGQRCARPLGATAASQPHPTWPGPQASQAPAQPAPRHRGMEGTVTRDVPSASSVHPHRGLGFLPARACGRGTGALGDAGGAPNLGGVVARLPVGQPRGLQPGRSACALSASPAVWSLRLGQVTRGPASLSEPCRPPSTVRTALRLVRPHRPAPPGSGGGGPAGWHQGHNCLLSGQLPGRQVGRLPRTSPPHPPPTPRVFPAARLRGRAAPAADGRCEQKR